MWLRIFSFLPFLCFSLEVNAAGDLNGRKWNSDGISATTTLAWSQDKSNPASGKGGTTNTVKGVTVSVAKRISEAFSVTADFTYKTSNQLTNEITAGFSKPGRLWRDGKEINLIANFTSGPFAIAPQIRIGHSNYELDRPDTKTRKMAMATSEGWYGGAYVEATATIPISQFAFIRPVVTYDLEITNVNAFTETGSQITHPIAGLVDTNVSYASISDMRSYAEIGAALGAKLPAGDGINIMPILQAKYRHNMIIGPIKTRASLAASGRNLGEQAIAAGKERRGLLVDAGAIISDNDKLELWALYRGAYFAHSNKHGFGVRAKYAF